MASAVRLWACLAVHGTTHLHGVTASKVARSVALPAGPVGAKSASTLGRLAVTPQRHDGVLFVDGIALRDGLYLHLSDRDYKYGIDAIDIVVRADEGATTDEDGEWWIALRADQVFWDRSLHPRHVAVRASAIRNAARPPRASGG
ncbi:hypothetical protein [Actinoplanes sp. NPDC051859]|uniref:hypothetical protein n=1 Tax=Actinoplanes sp. NPDC051859 TaxID=3363909 RepID=UPI003792FF47